MTEITEGCNEVELLWTVENQSDLTLTFEAGNLMRLEVDGISCHVPVAAAVLAPGEMFQQTFRLELGPGHSTLVSLTAQANEGISTTVERKLIHNTETQGGRQAVTPPASTAILSVTRRTIPCVPENATCWYQDDTIWNGKSTNSFYFRLDADFQYAKIWIENKSGGPIIVATSYEGNEFGDSHTIENGKSKIVYVNSNGNEGGYSVDITADKGHTLNGTISLKTGTKSGVGYPWTREDALS